MASTKRRRGNKSLDNITVTSIVTANVDQLCLKDGTVNDPSICNQNITDSGINFVGNAISVVHEGVITTTTSPTTFDVFGDQTITGTLVVDDQTITGILEVDNIIPVPDGGVAVDNSLFIRMNASAGIPRFIRFRSTTAPAYAGLVFAAFGTNNVYMYHNGTVFGIATSATNLDSGTETPPAPNVMTIQQSDGQVDFLTDCIFSEPVFLADQVTAPVGGANRIYTYDTSGQADLYFDGDKVNVDHVESGNTKTLDKDDVYRVTSDVQTITLPLATARPGATIAIVNIGNWTTTVSRQGSDTIDDAATTTINLNGDRTHVSVRSDGISLWMVV
jgi:hypothetical protein